MMHDDAVNHASRSVSGAIDGELWSALAMTIRQREAEMVTFRRRMHAAPEASNEEFVSTAMVAETLTDAGLTPQIMPGGLGVVCDLDLGASGDSVIALRAELDCVQVEDEKSVEYASTRAGRCHACGHDAHTTMVLHTGLALAGGVAQLREHAFRHNLRLLFQPAEETATGARAMIEQGALENVAAIIALHVEPFFPTGVVGLRIGPLTAACRTFRVTLRGKSGHSARPHEAVDPIPAAVNLVSLFYQLGPRSMDSRHPLSLTVGSILSGESFNAIPDEAFIHGTLRTTRLQDQRAVEARMHAVARGVAEATGCEVALEFLEHAPQTENDPEIIGIVAKCADELFGAEAVHWIDLPSMGGEDFAFYQQVRPGAIVRFGTGGSDQTATSGATRHPLHSSLFDIDEAALPAGALLLARSALTLANEYTPRPA